MIDGGSVAPDEVRPDMEALLEARAAFFDPAGTVGSGAVSPRFGPLPRKGPIAIDRVARIEAFSSTGSFGGGPSCAPTAEPFAPSGRFCGDVRLPGATLTDEEVRRVTALLEAAEGKYGPKSARDGRYASRPVLRCGFDPHHAFVLYDADGRVLGAITVCMTCHEWVVRPSSPGTGENGEVLFDDAERKTLGAILEAHHLGAWIFDDADPRQAEVIAYERRVYGTEEDPTARGVARRAKRLEASRSGVAVTKKLSELTVAERDLLCQWTSDVVRPGRRNGGGHGYDCPNGVSWSAMYGEKSCRERPLACSVSVSDLEACLRVLREPEDLCGPPPERCRPLMDCLPGIERRGPR